MMEYFIWLVCIPFVIITLGVAIIIGAMSVNSEQEDIRGDDDVHTP